MTVLNEKQVPYSIEYIDLSNKPEWFLAISPTGKVPVLRTPGGRSIFESAVINEYLEECYEPRLLPDEPLDRADDRMWRDYMVGLYGAAYRLYASRTEADGLEAVKELRSRLAALEGEIAGPYYRGERFSLIDVAAGPPLMRMTWVERVKPALGLFAGMPRVVAWRDALMDRPSIRDSVLPDIFERFVQSLQERGSWLSSRPADQDAR